MVAPDTFLTLLSVMVDELCKTSLPPEPHAGPRSALRRREVVTWAIFGPWEPFGRERGVYRYAQRQLRAACPRLPTRAQCNRQRRQHHGALVACLLHLVQRLAGRCWPSEALDSSGMPTRDAKRRGAGGLPGGADRGWSHRLGWSEGVPLRLAVPPRGVSTGVGCGAARTKEQPLAAPCLALRRQPQPGLARVGAPACGPYVVDQGCEGHANHQPWWRAYGAQVICPPKRTSPAPWPKRLRRWRAGGRPSVETVSEQLWPTFRLERERPQDLGGCQVRLAAPIALHTFCLWVQEQLGQPRLACTGLVDWSSQRISHQAFNCVWLTEPCCRFTAPADQTDC
jgi:hypothetical protein